MQKKENKANLFFKSKMVGKRMPYVLKIGGSDITKDDLNVRTVHDDHHHIDDTGFYQVMAKDSRGMVGLNLICHKIAGPSIYADGGYPCEGLYAGKRLSRRLLRRLAPDRAVQASIEVPLRDR